MTQKETPSTTTDHQALPPDQLQRILRYTRMTMFVQAILGVATGVFMLVLLGTAADGDTGGLALIGVLTAVSILLAAALLTCAVVLPRRPPWVRGAIMVIEWIFVLGGVINLIVGLSSGTIQPLAFLPIILGFAVIQPLVRPDVKAWFAGEPTLPQ